MLGSSPTLSDIRNIRVVHMCSRTSLSSSLLFLSWLPPPAPALVIALREPAKDCVCKMLDCSPKHPA